MSIHAVGARNYTQHQLLAVPSKGGSSVCPQCEAIERVSEDPKLEFELTLATVTGERAHARAKKSRTRAALFRETTDEFNQLPAMPRKERTEKIHDAFSAKVRASMKAALLDSTCFDKFGSFLSDMQEKVKADDKHIV